MLGLNKNTYFSAVDLALTAIFTALWVTLNLALGPLSFSLFRLPILHDFGVFFTLLLVTWVTGRFGTSSLAGIIGSIIAIALGGPIIIAGFAAAAVLFDLILFAARHKICISKSSLIIAAIATIVSAYFAGALIGIFFMNNGLQWALTVWGGWHLIGGAIAGAVTIPIIVALEKASVRKMKTD
jgi:hypothetical protein